MPRAIRQPNIRELVEAAKAMGLDPQPTERASTPSTPWEKGGFVEIKRTGSKIQTLRLMAGEIVRLRQRQAEQVQISSKRR